MYNYEIKKILAKNFGEPKNSLSIGTKSRKENTKTYFYKLSNEKEIYDFLYAVNYCMPKESVAKFKDLFDIYEKKEKYISDQCVSFRESSDDGWEIEFYNVKKIQYHKTRGNKIVAHIKLDTHPLARIKEQNKEMVYGLFGRPIYVNEKAHRQESEGMSYWINKYIYLNKQFRSFIVEFLFLVGEDNYIYKDVARTIEKTHCFLPEINGWILPECRKPSEIFSTLRIDYKKININPNKMDINTLYVISKIIPYIHGQDYKILMSISYEDIIQLIDIKTLFNGMSSTESIIDFIANYYTLKNAITKTGKHFIKMYASDYAATCIELNEPIRLNYSYDQLEERHDRMANILRHKANEEELVLPLVATPSKFDRLEQKIQNNYPNMFKRMCSTQDLYDEGEYQHNCVFQRRHIVREDLASIYHWKYHDKDYTIQFSIDYNGQYQIDEIMARFNEPCEKEERKVIDKIVDEINRKAA